MPSKTIHWFMRENIEPAIIERDKKKLTQLEDYIVCRLADINRFYKWPALRDSYIEDLHRVQKVLRELEPVPMPAGRIMTRRKDYR